MPLNCYIEEEENTDQMTGFIIMLAAAALLAGTYLFVLFSRALKTFGMESNKKRRIISLLLVLSVFLCIYLFSGYTVIAVFEVFMASALMEILNLILKRSGSEAFREKWKKIYGSGILPVVIAAVVLIYGYINVENVVITNYDLATDKKIPGGHLKIVLIADLHAGTTFTLDEFKEECERINDQKPDILLLGGDIFDEGTPKKLMEDVTAALGGIDAKYGKYYVFGNHDNGVRGNNGNFDLQLIEKEMTENNITILSDETVSPASGIMLIGRIDSSFDAYSRARKGIDELTGNTDRKDYIIVLDHQPKDLKESAKAGADLHLSGHTHAGQLWPLGLLGPVLRFNEMTYGLEKRGDMDSIVTSGIAVWGAPFRTEKHSEIVVVDLVQNK